MKIVTQFILAMVVTITGLAADKPRRIQEDDIREVVFRYQLKDQPGTTNRYYLAVGEPRGDPSDDLLKRFSGYATSFQKVSECRIVSLRVIDRKSGKRGTILQVSHIKWISDLEVEVRGGYYEHGKSASGNTYTLVNKEGKWRVTNDKEDWVS